MGKCFDCGAAGGVATAGAVGGFLAGAGACARAEQEVAATMAMTLKKKDRAGKGMRSDESPEIRIPRGGRAAQMAIGANHASDSATEDTNRGHGQSSPCGTAPGYGVFRDPARSRLAGKTALFRAAD
jgi:hypothetical protein